MTPCERVDELWKKTLSQQVDFRICRILAVFFGIDTLLALFTSNIVEAVIWAVLTLLMTVFAYGGHKLSKRYLQEKDVILKEVKELEATNNAIDPKQNTSGLYSSPTE